ncbi:putative respiratory complex assembly protein Rmp1 [Aspergillus affinis]|uniref:putative respiratory complex assembly protein Rmp1 n=1 Tax=Aspergillus affinis TaxID=1070780 RepID=UPI0022FDEB82|nr:respiratory complex assembly protein Rmp1 [Aspergillus affinis]KAI9045722.1 respiratory complex assembly protein Rmp1 [Aspergillus affinis]
MLSRSSQAAADLLSCRPSPICRKCTPSRALRRYDVFLRSNSQQSDEPLDEDENQLPRLTLKPRMPFQDAARRKGQWGTRVPNPVTALGEQAEVLVLKDKDRERKYPGLITNEPADEGGLSKMLKDIEGSDTLVDEDLVTENFEYLRRYKPGVKLSLDEWHDHRQKTGKSFTIKQMRAYISESLRKEEEEDGRALEHGKRVSSEWRPGISTFLDTADVHDGVRVTKSQENVSAKDILVETILRDCWKLGIVGETGQLDYQISPPLLSLLVRSTNFSFEVLAGLHDVRVDLTHSIGLVRITGTQKACEALRDVVHDATTRIREEDIQLYSQDGPSAKSIDRILKPEFLSWINTTYGVVIEQHASKPSKLFYLVENKEGADNARRTLNLAIHDVTAPQTPFSTYVSASEPMPYHNFSPEDNTIWWNREKPWLRWAVPSAQSSEAKDLQTPIFDRHDRRLTDELLKLLRQKSSPKIDCDNDVGVHESISAAVGRCLFQRKPFLVNETISANQLGKLSVPRTFNTDVPQLASILRQLTPLLPIYTRHHRIQLVPSWKHANVFPTLDIEFSLDVMQNDVDLTDKVRLQNFKTILSESTVDYLLPENGLDLRFTRKLTRDLLEGAEINPSFLDLQETLNGVFLKARANREDRPLPAFIDLSLPNHVLSNASENADPSGESVGEYMFMPVNSIRTTSLHRYYYRGHALNYSYFESGPYYAHQNTDCFLDFSLAKGSSVSAHSKPSDSVQAIDFNSFYKAACALAFDVDKAGRATPLRDIDVY